MPTRTIVCRTFFLVVLSAGVGCAGDVFAAEVKVKITTTDSVLEMQVPEKPNAPAANVPRELAMRPLPAYRIEPPDILQIEITSSKGTVSGASQSSTQSEQGVLIGGTGTVSGSGTVIGNVATEPSGAITIAPNGIGSTTINAGSLTKSGGAALTKRDTGTLTISGSNTDSGATTISGGSQPQNDAGTLNLSATNTYSSDTVTFSGDGSPRTGGAWWIASDANKFSGGTTIGGGTVTGTVAVTPGNANPVGTGTTRVFVLSGAAGPTGRAKFERTIPSIPRVEPGSGQYLVGPDGTINLRQYGTLQVTGMTIAEVKAALEKHLAKYIDSPEVTVDVLGYNSKVFYIIIDGAGLGDNVRRIPICGKETVLDAVAAVGGLSQLSSRKMWLARPSPTNAENGIILPIDYEAITQRGATATNYQIMPGDRIFIAGDSTIALNNNLSKATAPVERMMGLISLGAATIRSVGNLLPQQSHRQKYKSEDDF